MLSEMFDKTGRRRVPSFLAGKIQDPLPEFTLDRPGLSLSFIKQDLPRYRKFMGDPGISEKRYIEEIPRLYNMIFGDPLAGNIMRGAWLPIVISKIINYDLGKELDRYLTAIRGSYEEAFPGKKFLNEFESLAGRVGFAAESRNCELFDRLKNGPVIGLYFPLCLQGYSVDACRAQMSGLPEGFYLSGLDAAAAMVMYPDFLAEGQTVPGLYLSAFSCLSQPNSLVFKPTEYNLQFSDTHYRHSTLTIGQYSGGLFFAK